MGRKERPLDPDGGTLAEFASRLRRAREAAGSPPYRQLARQSGYSASSLATAAAGQHLPSLDVTLAMVKALGEDPDEWRVRWEEVRDSLAEPAIVDGPPVVMPNINAVVPDINVEPPVPNRGRALAGFADRLRELRLLAGEPGLRVLERADSSLKKTTVGNVLNGNTNPTLDLVLRFVRVCASLADEHGLPLTAEQHDPERWRTEWMRLQRDLREHRRRTTLP